jgi:uncharacterized membrane protein
MKINPPLDFQGDAVVSVFPTTSQEFINLIAHYYRGEIARMAGWRDRIDRTTNWAITCVAAMLSISWSTPGGHHEIILFAMTIVALLLIIESRRYRFFDVYRRRVRMIEHGYYAEVFGRRNEPHSDWRENLACDLRLPQFAVSRGEAFRRRLRRNYIWLFLILLAAWVLQISRTHVLSGYGGSYVADLLGDAAIGALPGEVVVTVVSGVYIALIIAALVPRKMDMEPLDGQVHV